MIKHLQVSSIQQIFIKKKEFQILLFKNLLTSNTFISNEIILKYFLKEISKTFNRFTSRSRNNTVCVLTGRTRSVYQKVFRATRMQVREKANIGLYPGIRKSSW